MTKLITENAELLLYLDGKLHLTILGGIKLTGLDRMKVTLKITRTDNKNNAFRHNLDLYNSIQLEQLTEKSAEALDVSTAEISKIAARPKKRCSAVNDGESSIPQTPWESAADAKGRALPSRETKALSISSRQNLFSFTSAKIIRGSGWSSVKHPKAGEGEAVKGTWNKWPLCVKGFERLCRESPFTAFPSEATFAVTDDPSYTSRKLFCANGKLQEKTGHVLPIFLGLLNIIGL